VFSSPGAPSTMRNSGRRKPRPMRSSSTARQASVLTLPMALTASRTCWPSARTPMITSSEIGSLGGRALPEPRCRRESTARLVLLAASGHSRRPSRSSPCARPGSPCPCRSHRGTGLRERGAHGAYWCQPDSSWRSQHRRPACDAGRPAARDSSTRWSRPREYSAGRAALRYPPSRMCPAANVGGGRAADL